MTDEPTNARTLFDKWFVFKILGIAAGWAIAIVMIAMNLDVLVQAGSLVFFGAAAWIAAVAAQSIKLVRSDGGDPRVTCEAALSLLALLLGIFPLLRLIGDAHGI